MKTTISRHSSLFSFSLLLLSVWGTSGCDSTIKAQSANSGNNVQEPQQGGLYTIQAERLEVPQPAEVDPGDSLAYPVRSAFQLKSLQTDDWADREQLLDAGLGGVAINFKWSEWQPVAKTRCNAKTEFSYDGYCFLQRNDLDQKVRYWTQKGVIVSAVIWGVPNWARVTENCFMNGNRKEFCAPKNSADFARFAGMLAQRYDGKHGKGRIPDFIIHNEVNMNQWYNVGCGNGVACEINHWVNTYASDYNAAYDAILSRQATAKVFAPFAHQFGERLTNLSADLPVVSVKTFIRAFHPMTAGRKWRIAYHPYNKRLQYPEFGPSDLPHVTYGNIGVLASWLRAEFPNHPESWEIHLTESGINSIWLYSSEQEQAEALCNSFRNILGTPGILNHVYHRMVDHPGEVVHGGGFGLHNEDRTPKQSWFTWAEMSGNSQDRSGLDCGFENVPYTKLVQYGADGRNSWASTRVPPAEYFPQASWKLLRKYVEGTAMLYECKNDDGAYVSSDLHCGGDLSYGPVGYVYAAARDNTLPLFACKRGSNRYSSSEESCGAGEMVEFLGHSVR